MVVVTVPLRLKQLVPNCKLCFMADLIAFTYTPLLRVKQGQQSRKYCQICTLKAT